MSPDPLEADTAHELRAGLVSAAAISVEGLRFRYPGSKTDVLDGMDLAIEAGERARFIHLCAEAGERARRTAAYDIGARHLETTLSLGAGSLGTSIADGLVDAGQVTPADLTLTRTFH